MPRKLLRHRANGKQQPAAVGVARHRRHIYEQPLHRRKTPHPQTRRGVDDNAWVVVCGADYRARHAAEMQSHKRRRFQNARVGVGDANGRGYRARRGYFHGDAVGSEKHKFGNVAVYDGVGADAVENSQRRRRAGQLMGADDSCVWRHGLIRIVVQNNPRRRRRGRRVCRYHRHRRRTGARKRGEGFVYAQCLRGRNVVDKINRRVNGQSPEADAARGKVAFAGDAHNGHRRQAAERRSDKGGEVVGVALPVKEVINGDIQTLAHRYQV